MNRVWKLYDAAQSELLPLHRHSSSKHRAPPPLPVFTPAKLSKHRFKSDLNPHTQNDGLSKIIRLFDNFLASPNARVREELTPKVSRMRDELLQNIDDLDKVVSVLDEKGLTLVRSYSNGSAFVELLNQLHPYPYLALEAFNWRRKQAECSTPMTSEEYAKGIRIAGRINVDLALELFAEATNKRLKNVSTYNALMSVYMFSGYPDKCQSLFQDLKNEPSISPSIVTYNILLSVFGRLALVEQMEATFQELKDLNLSPNVTTYNYLISGYVTAWMWDSMEKTFQMINEGPVKPNIYTYLKMLRGYANSGNLDQMERTYELVKQHVNDMELSLIRTMICAYCKSSAADRLMKIQVLLKHIPEKEYRSWLNVLLIKVYAEGNWLEEMEKLIDQAFEHKTMIQSQNVIRAIIGNYFRSNALDKLENFIRRAEFAGWIIIRSLYHCKMVMYASQKRLGDMESVLSEMENQNISRTKRTLIIMRKAYSMYGHRLKVESIMGLMCKYGYDTALALPS